jgi:DNA-binding NtrC family response regulator
LSAVMSVVNSVLIVDDEPDICEALEMALTMEGYAVKSALDRENALTVIAGGKPGIIFLDYRMPGLDIHQFLGTLKTNGVDCPIVLMTGNKDPWEQARELGLEHHLQKPFELDAMVALVRKLSS